MKRHASGAATRCAMAMIAAMLMTILAVPASGQVTVTVPATSNPYLAGMPNGSTCCSGDSAPAQSPVQVIGFPVTPGTTLTFSATGAMHFEPGPLTPTPDGGVAFSTVSSNGISGATWPVDSLIGVFLDNNQPDLTAAPAAPDFSGSGLGTAFTTLSPLLKQVFFIGDGVTGTGSGTVQSFVVPAGATRLFLGVSDGFGWANNIGSFTVTVSPAAAPPPAPAASAVPILGPWLLAILGALLGTAAVWRLRPR